MNDGLLLGLKALDPKGRARLLHLSALDGLFGEEKTGGVLTDFGAFHCPRAPQDSPVVFLNSCGQDQSFMHSPPDQMETPQAQHGPSTCPWRTRRPRSLLSGTD